MGKTKKQWELKLKINHKMELQMLNLILKSPLHKSDVGSGALQLSPISINKDYCKEWNIREEDYVCLTKNGELISPSLYRVGGIGGNIKNNYFLLLKYIEAYYSKDILHGSKNQDPKHLEGRWCIIDKNGIEKIEFPHFKTPYLVRDSCIYSVDNKYFNIETGHFYCNTNTSMESNDFLFLENSYDKDKSKCGVIKINKKDGSMELFS